MWTVFSTFINPTLYGAVGLSIALAFKIVYALDVDEEMEEFDDYLMTNVGLARVM